MCGGARYCWCSVSFIVSSLRPGDSPEHHPHQELFQVNRVFQRQALRGATNQKPIVSWDKLPGVSLHVEDRQVLRVNFYYNLFALSRIQFDFVHDHQPLWRLSRIFRQSSIDFSNLSSRSIAGIRHFETQAYSFSVGHFQIRIVVSGVREAIRSEEHTSELQSLR